jgi:hypothetical protein
MRSSAVLFVVLFVPVAVADEPKRVAERTPPVKFPPQHTDERAGTTAGLSRFAVLTPTPGTGVGYVNGAFGSDHVGAPRRFARIFNPPAADPSRGPAISDHYRTDAAPVPDVFALRPFRNAVIGAKEAGRPHR